MPSVVRDYPKFPISSLLSLFLVPLFSYTAPALSSPCPVFCPCTSPSLCTPIPSALSLIVHPSFHVFYLSDSQWHLLPCLCTRQDPSIPAVSHVSLALLSPLESVCPCLLVSLALACLFETPGSLALWIYLCLCLLVSFALAVPFWVLWLPFNYSGTHLSKMLSSYILISGLSIT